MSYTDVGEGPALLALHGAPGSVRDWRWLGPCIEDRARFIRLDQPGFGGTPRSSYPSPSFEGRARWLLRVLDGLKIERCAVVGHSIGGGLAAELGALDNERIRGVALVASMGPRAHHTFRRQPFEQQAAGLLELPLLQLPLSWMIRRGFEQAGFPKGISLATIRQTMRLAWQADFARHGRNITKLRAPTLVAWAEDDHLIEPPIFEELAAGCPEGPRLRFEAGGHNIQKSQAVELGDALVGWLQSLELEG